MASKKPTTKALRTTARMTSTKAITKKVTREKLIPWDEARYINNEKEAILYINLAFADYSDDPAFVAEAFGVAARAVGMSKIAKKTGLSREALYRALSYDGNPEFATILKVANALGVTFKVK